MIAAEEEILEGNPRRKKNQTENRKKNTQPHDTKI